MKAVYAGSFDPFTFGHLSIVKDALEFFDKIIIVCSINSTKKPNFSRTDMVDAIEKIFKNLGFNSDEVQVIRSDKLIVNICEEYNASHIVRGLRNPNDYLYEEEIAKFNHRMNPNIKTVYFRAEDECISSSAVRELFFRGLDISEFVPKEIIEAMNLTSGK